MDTELAGWTAEEQQIARRAFEQALSREVEALIDTLRRETAALSGAEQVWQLHDFLSIRRHQIEGRSSFHLDGLLFVFADFVKAGLTSFEELDGLSGDKQAKIRAMARM
ncbi:MAG: hypothetical protein ACK522_10325 [Synechococcaceae cyanobacterium]|jgi:hypothetical protein